MGKELPFHSFLTSALNGKSGRLHDPFALPPGNKPLVHTGYWAGWATALVALALLGIEPRHVVCFGRSLVSVTAELSEPLI